LPVPGNLADASNVAKYFILDGVLEVLVSAIISSKHDLGVGEAGLHSKEYLSW
jgi:hypothetical protein